MSHRATDTKTAFGNPFRSALASKRPLVGIWSMLNSVHAIEGLAYSGFDWVLIDGEHAPLTLADAMSHLRTLEGKSLVPIVRLAWNDSVLLKQYLDAGVRTLMLPFVQSGEEAAQAVAAMRYPPHGHRGVALMHRASRYGRTKDYLRHAHRDLFLIVQIETRSALDRLEEIAATDGVGALFFGPSDLAASLGHIGQPDHPRVMEAIRDARERVRATGKAAGVLAPNGDVAEQHLRAGFDFVSVTSDCALLFHGADATAARFRAVAEQAAGTAPGAGRGHG
ncbi:MAG: aldolase/citrate lyase family protein [Kiloniellales bacterium]|nr:aldolase/citrate lyase family protein [Kiloniellales bacterium]